MNPNQVASGNQPNIEPRKLGRPSKYHDGMCDIVVEMGKTGAGRAEMAAALDIARETWTDWLNPNSPRYNVTFSDAVKRALQLSQAWWEEQGRISTFNAGPHFSATSYIFQMKNRFREDWADRTVNEHTGKDGEAIEIKDSGVDARRVAFMLGRAVGRSENKKSTENIEKAKSDS